MTTKCQTRGCDDDARYPLKEPTYCRECVTCPRCGLWQLKLSRRSNGTFNLPELCVFCAGAKPLLACRECKIHPPVVPAQSPVICESCRICPECKVRKRSISSSNTGYANTGSKCNGCVKGLPPRQPHVRPVVEPVRKVKPVIVRPIEFKTKALAKCRECKVNVPTLPECVPTICTECQFCPTCKVRKRGISISRDGYVTMVRQCAGCRLGDRPKRKADELAADVLLKIRKTDVSFSKFE